MQKSSYYERLGLPRDASKEEIRHAYRQLVLRLHPDKNVNKGETDLFIDLQQAYEQLSDPIRRGEYNNYLPEEPSHESPLDLQIYYSQPSLVRLPEPQLIYALLKINLRTSADQLAAYITCSTSGLTTTESTPPGVRRSSTTTCFWAAPTMSSCCGIPAVRSCSTDVLCVVNPSYYCPNGGISIQNGCDALIVNNTIIGINRAIKLFDHPGRLGLPYCLSAASGRATVITVAQTP